MGAVWDFITNNQLGAGIVSGLVVAAVIAVVPSLRAHFVRLVKWAGRSIGQRVRRLANGVRRIGSGNKQAAVDVTPYIQERDEVRRELETWKEEALNARHYMKYGEPLPEFTALPEVRHEDMVTRVSELGPTTGWMMTYCAEVWRALQPRYKEGDPDSAVRDLIRFLNEKAHYPLQNTAQALDEYVRGRRDPRAFLVCFYKRYREWRQWILKLANYLGVDVRTLAGYAKWREHDDEWLKELTKKVASPNMSGVHRLIHEYNHEHGEMVSLPEPGERPTG